MKKKLIEVALPLETINAEAAREKSIRHGHPSTLHLWWARRPLAACRAVLFASLVDDPSSHPEQFPTEETVIAERQRLFRLIERLVVWENIGENALYEEAYTEIQKSTEGNPPPVLDPFAGGGSIPLEAQRLGLEAHASDLNPVAVLINKALIEIPSRFVEHTPVNPEAKARIDIPEYWYGASGLAEDVRYYGQWMKNQVEKHVGYLYPKVTLPNGIDATVIAWIWARTVKCPNPACGAEMPLVSSFELSKKKGKEAWVLPQVIDDGKTVSFEVQIGKGDVPDGTVNRMGARCICCGQPVGFPYIRAEGKAGRIGAKMMAIVADGKNGRVFLSPNGDHVAVANIQKPVDYPDAPLPLKALGFRIQQYGMKQYADLFTPRQLNTIVTFSDFVTDVISQVRADAVAVGMLDDNVGLNDGGCNAKAYSEAVGVYLAMLVNQVANHSTSVCGWNSVNTQMRSTFARQAISMVWDYAEVNPFCFSSGSYSSLFERQIKGFQGIPARRNLIASAVQKDATIPFSSEQNPIVISTDPPYYDNIGYADLSDFFYVWLRRSLRDVYPKLFSTMLVPKMEELIATPYRFEGSAKKARNFFEDGMLLAFCRMRESASPLYPLTVYYAFKQSESEENYNGDGKNTASTGWESMLQALIQAGFSITGTWPLRTEKPGRTREIESNALASSIALVCRPRPDNASSTTRRAFLSELREALKVGISDLQSGNIAPVDLAQASIGPGMAVYSKYAEVLEANGNPMSIRAALVLINQEMDAYLTGQETIMDTESRFCIAWFEDYGLQCGKYDDAVKYARAKMANLQELANNGVLEMEHGNVRLKRRDELPEKWNAAREKTVWTMVQQLCRCISEKSLVDTAQYILDLGSSESEKAKALAYRAYIATERKGWTEEALAYNGLVTSWPELMEKANELRNIHAEQMKLDM